MPRKILKAGGGILSALWLNLLLLKARLSSRKIIIFQMHAANQLPHIMPILQKISINKNSSKYYTLLLVYPGEIKDARKTLDDQKLKINISTYYATTFLTFWDAVVALDQRMRFPIICCGSGAKICIFHGQPTKGNVYSGFNYKQINNLFFYGPLMRNYYAVQKNNHPEWPHIHTWDIGQPKSDALYKNKISKIEAKLALGLVPSLPTILYAPSFESCASLAIAGKEIISILHNTKCNLIVKPHPSFYRKVDENDKYFHGVPYADEWREFSGILEASGTAIFPLNAQIDTNLALAAADVLVTDHSGISFDAILLDKPVIYFDCPLFFTEYLPKMFGVNGEEARHDITCNAGRSAGITVSNTEEMVSAVDRYLNNPALHFKEREDLRLSLLYNQGHATDIFMRTLDCLVEV